MNTLTDTIYEEIYEDIISGSLQPGQKLHIASLAEKYNVGLSPIREALSRLSASDLVTAKSQRGFIVAPISQTDLHDLYKTRSYIEETALSLSIKNGDDSWEANILATFHSLAKFETQQIKNKEEYKEWEKRHRAFNLALINACNLNYLLQIQKKLYDLTERYRRQWLLAGLKNKNGLQHAKDQKKIMNAALARDSQLATKLLHKHFENAVQIIEAYFLSKNLFENSSLRK